MYFRQLGELTLTVTVGKSITDENWSSYLEGSLAIAEGFGVPAKSSFLCCVNAFPSARQRQLACDFLTHHKVHEPSRLAVVTESLIIRGAMTAFSWTMPKVGVKAFANNGVRDAVGWLREVGNFDEAQALAAWHEAKMKLSIRSTSLFPPASRSGSR